MKYFCIRCEKILSKKDEIEKSDHYGEFYCSPDCATDAYFEYAMSHPSTYEEMVEEQINQAIRDLTKR
ncbi:hypothetical protein LCGC14_0464750 [marine sediment metagenome]|uniref:Uncharacterized protein n=1 Tax=marine sediment metagenome TaxID=412755 RepID=A0A0F9VMV0_9ZZZZ